MAYFCLGKIFCNDTLGPCVKKTWRGGSSCCCFLCPCLRLCFWEWKDKWAVETQANSFPLLIPNIHGSIPKMSSFSDLMRRPLSLVCLQKKLSPLVCGRHDMLASFWPEQLPCHVSAQLSGASALLQTSLETLWRIWRLSIVKCDQSFARSMESTGELLSSLAVCPNASSTFSSYCQVVFSFALQRLRDGGYGGSHGPQLYHPRRDHPVPQGRCHRYAFEV